MPEPRPAARSPGSLRAPRLRASPVRALPRGERPAGKQRRASPRGRKTKRVDVRGGGVGGCLIPCACKVNVVHLLRNARVFLGAVKWRAGAEAAGGAGWGGPALLLQPGWPHPAPPERQSSSRGAGSTAAF